MKINYYSTKAKNTKIKFGFFTRQGGLSLNNFSSLNCSYSSGDQKKLVKQNIKIALKNIKLNEKFLKLPNQTHSNKVVIINKYNLKEKIIADGLITQDHNINLGILTADCCPIFIYDKDETFICCLHSGWKGTYKNIIKNALSKIDKIQPDKKKIKAAIGPCLNKKNFEVKNNFKKKFLDKDKENKTFFYNKLKKNMWFFDMRGLIKNQLLNNNITQIENFNLDTYSNKNLFFSHRRSTHFDDLPAGRMINIIGFARKT